MMGLFDKIKEPIILKSDSSAKQQLSELERLFSEISDSKIKAAIERDITAVNAGIYGEDTILFELQNSHIPMCVIHDLYLEFEGLTAQIDFLIVTRKRIFVIECKNLYGDITINNTGDFIRSAGGKKEGIYSPVTQGKRHLELIKKIRSADKGNIVTKTIFERSFYDGYRSVVVLANPKTVLNAKYARKEIKDQVIRADQLIEYIKRVNSEPGADSMGESVMQQLAEFYLGKHSNPKIDYTEKYRKTLADAPEQIVDEVTVETVTAITNVNEEVPVCPKCGAPMIKRKSTKGANANNDFWGCSKFPKCRGIISLNQD